MAIIRSGVLGNTRGKVAGVVGSQWKDKNYLREYVKPANPNTAAQQVQRTKMSDAVAFSKSLVGPVFNAYTDKFQKSMSGFNFFIKQNIAIFDGTPDYSAMFLTEGKLFTPVIIAAVATANVVTIGFNTDLGNNGATDDAVYAACYDSATGLWNFASAEETRVSGEIVVGIPNKAPADDVECYIWAIRYSGTLVDIISNSDYMISAE